MGERAPFFCLDKTKDTFSDSVFRGEGLCEGLVALRRSELERSGGVTSQTHRKRVFLHESAKQVSTCPGHRSIGASGVPACLCGGEGSGKRVRLSPGVPGGLAQGPLNLVSDLRKVAYSRHILCKKKTQIYKLIACGLAVLCQTSVRAPLWRPGYRHGSLGVLL